MNVDGEEAPGRTSYNLLHAVRTGIRGIPGTGSGRDAGYRRVRPQRRAGFFCAQIRKHNGHSGRQDPEGGRACRFRRRHILRFYAGYLKVHPAELSGRRKAGRPQYI